MKAKLFTAVMLTGLMFSSCKKEIEPEPITVMVTVDDGEHKVIKFIYQGSLVWQSDPDVKTMSTRQEGLLTFLDYVSMDGKESHLVFLGGEIKKQ